MLITDTEEQAVVLAALATFVTAHGNTDDDRVRPAVSAARSLLARFDPKRRLMRVVS